MATYYKTERECSECGQQFWGTAGANFCSNACRSRNWRTLRALGRWRGLALLCDHIVHRSRAGKESSSKLLIRLLRATAGELRSRGWDPVELLAGSPEDPVTGDDDSPGGIEGSPPNRRKWLHSPALELELLEDAIEQGNAGGDRSTEWHEARRAELVQQIAAPAKPRSD